MNQLPNIMTLLVTSLGFVVANFLLDWLVASDEPLMNLNKLA
jgi:uncharacterized membrane protein YwzB